MWEGSFNSGQFRADIHHVVRAMDNVIDRTIYPLPAQEQEAKAKRRMGLGITGTANAIEAMGYPYGSEGYIQTQSHILEILRDESYKASIELAKEKGAFPLFNPQYLAGGFVATLPEGVQQDLRKHGIRNSHLTSIAPTGTISLSADNISSGLEPVFAYNQQRTIINEDGVTARLVELRDYGYAKWGVKGKTTEQLSASEHVAVLVAAQKFVDSAISKTCNVGDGVGFEEFKDIYMTAWRGGAKGCTTFRPSGKRFGVLSAKPTTEEAASEAVCYINPDGSKSCE